MPTDHRHHAILGLSPGGGAADPGELDFSSLPAVFDSGVQSTIYEFFARGPNGENGPDSDPFDLATPGSGIMRNIIFTPNGRGGFIVEHLIVPEPGSLALLAAGALGVSLTTGRRRVGRQRR
jgi:hypothetical protein